MKTATKKTNSTQATIKEIGIDRTEIISSKILSDGSNIEMIYNQKKAQSLLVICKDTNYKLRSSFTFGDITYKPHSATKDLIRNNVILFPSHQTEYGTEKKLLATIQKFIHKYVSLSDFFERISTYYVLFSWIYDDFNELPYLRCLGDYGTGKSRFLKVIGSICYKPTFTSGASTVSPIFRIINEFNGTLIIDEADFRFSDTTAEMTKILNSGFMKNTPVFRTTRNSKDGFDVASFNVFCPKIIATRELFQDKALESRMITENMNLNYIRDDIPFNLPNTFEEEALNIRNKLLMFRFNTKGKTKLKIELENRNIEPRLNQIAIPIMSIMSDPSIIKEMQQHMIDYNDKIQSEKASSNEYQLLEIICNLIDEGHLEPTVGLITKNYNQLLNNPNKHLTTRKIGYLIRTKLHLTTRKTRDGFVLSTENSSNIKILKNKYKIKSEHSEQCEH